MGVIQLPRVLLCDDSITGGILIVRAIDLNQMPLSMMRKTRENRECFPFALVIFLKAKTVCSDSVCLLGLNMMDKQRNRK